MSISYGSNKSLTLIKPPSTQKPRRFSKPNLPSFPHQQLHQSSMMTSFQNTATVLAMSLRLVVCGYFFLFMTNQRVRPRSSLRWTLKTLHSQKPSKDSNYFRRGNAIPTLIAPRPIRNGQRRRLLHRKLKARRSGGGFCLTVDGEAPARLIYVLYQGDAHCISI